jgi:peptide/nickel transport system ATP-binding protein
MGKILEIRDLKIGFDTEHDRTIAVDGISLFLNKGETLGIVGESGSGKTVTALSVLNLLPAPEGRITGGEILYYKDGADHGLDLTRLDPARQTALRGSEISMIFQEPMSSLNPVMPCGLQVTEAIRLHKKITREEARLEALALFKRVKLSEPERMFRAHPHQISGGQKQRIMIAMAMSCHPAILIADEPTTALDVTVQKTILDLLREIREESGLSMLFISHDLGVIAEICDRVAVMYQGKIVETGPVSTVLRSPAHPYTQGLLASRPSLNRKWKRLATVSDFMNAEKPQLQEVTTAETTLRRTALYNRPPLLEIRDLFVQFSSKRNLFGTATSWKNAVDNVSFNVFPGESFGIAGESGCGKSTLCRAIARLLPVQDGSILYKGVDLTQIQDTPGRPVRPEIQLIYQDPYSSLNPRMKIGDALLEPMRIHHLHENDRKRLEKATELLEMVGLQADHANRFPHEFSGGQRQRICLARALAVEPKVLICDEIVSSLDVSVQATILNLMADLQEKLGLTYLFVSHDLAVIRQLCDRMLVMNDGKEIATGFPEVLLNRQDHPFLQEMVNACLDFDSV